MNEKKQTIEKMVKAQMKTWAEDGIEEILEMEVSNIDEEEIEDELWVEDSENIKKDDLMMIIEDCFYTVQKKVRAALAIAEAAMY
jgi:hypothetical protein